MILFYLIALLPILIGGALWAINKNVHWVEWMICGVVAIVASGIMHGCAIHGMTADKEVHSGEIITARQFSRWKEYYEYAVYKTEYYATTEFYTDDKGRSRSRTVTKSRRVFSHWEPTSRWHEESFSARSNIYTSYGISRSKFI